MKKLFLVLCVFFPIPIFTIGQNLPIALKIINENLRRGQLLSDKDFSSSLMMRPITWNTVENDSISFDIMETFSPRSIVGKNKSFLSVLPIYSSVQVGGIPYPEASIFLQSKGFQSYISSGLYGQLGPLSIQLQPEFIYSQNLEYETGFKKSTNTEYLERFGEGSYNMILPGQSSVRLNFGAFSLGASTENIWWGPGQFNSLLFSNSAFGFEHLTFNTRRPAKTFIGNFEGQIISGRLKNSNLSSTNLIDPLSDWRYVNGLNIIYKPKWINGFYLGLSRVFQQYNSTMGSTFGSYFPIFEPLQKKNLVQDASNSSQYDDLGQDQQLTGFVRFINYKAKIELYFEYGRRDHALNWREAILNPEHARAYLIGFLKVFEAQKGSFYQVRGEVLQQQESINILIRYPGTGGSLNWSGHGTVIHGFTHRGQMLGPGVGPSSNVQILEGAWVKGFKKLGLRLERLNRHQDIYTKLFNDPSEQGRWVDLSARLLADWQWDNLILSSNINFVNSLNYQWQLDPISTPDFPKGRNLFAVHSQLSLIYLFHKKNNSRND